MYAVLIKNGDKAEEQEISERKKDAFTIASPSTYEVEIGLAEKRGRRSQ